MMQRLVAAGWFFFVASSSVLFFLLALVLRIITRPFDRRLVLLQQFTCFWASLYTWIIPAWRIHITGREHLPGKTPHVVVSNHQSLLDILVLFNLFFHFKFVSKIEIFKIPLIGWNMYLNQYIRLRRGDRKSVAQMMADCETAISRGNSVLIFPEGTRSPDGEIKDFKPGAFIVAHRTKSPILPVAIAGTNSALPKYSLNFHGRHDIRMHVLEPIAYERFAHLSVEDTAALVRRIIRESHEAIRQQSSQTGGPGTQRISA
ncbi:MAG TPA: lysophospholipid acyltransferase family protein [Desulfosalsimonadaceae bacterium]|nr:lysophospholipid acyltransferase family protein [Desulfosalsimonadaceae bacterium]